MSTDDHAYMTGVMAIGPEKKCDTFEFRYLHEFLELGKTILGKYFTMESRHFSPDTKFSLHWYSSIQLILLHARFYLLTQKKFCM